LAADAAPSEFRAPSAAERVLNTVVGWLVGLGFGLEHNHLLQVSGRRTGRIYRTPVNVLVLDGRRWLVAPRGRTQWVRNVEVSGTAVLKRGRRFERVRLRAVADADKPAILSAYLDRFRTTVQRYFPVAAGSPAQAFGSVASRYPVFEITP
jgi:deazaflavin-dependent oxidoreductase (nitroreductase family)